MLTKELKTLIANHSAGMVATINCDKTPSVSPKATFVIVDDNTIAFGNLRSPGTIANIKQRPDVEVCFIDVILRKAARITGKAVILPNDKGNSSLAEIFTNQWPAYVDEMDCFIKISIAKAELILSPAYDFGATESELKSTNLKRLLAF